MKNLFKLKEKKYVGDVYMTEEEAHRIYNNFGEDKYPVRRTCGFYVIPLSFEFWLDYHKIHIL